MFNRKILGCLLILTLSSCSEKKEVASVSGSQLPESRQEEVQVDHSGDVEVEFNEITAKLKNNSIDAREAGKLVSKALGVSKTEDLKNFNYERYSQIYSTFSKNLHIQFKNEKDKTLILLAESIGINTMEGYDALPIEKKEEKILERIKPLTEKSYLELEFYLANYFLNNKIFEALRAIPAETKDEDLTYCRGYLLKFVKEIYAKNSRYPDAFPKYAIWGEILNECNLAPIFLPGIAQLKTSSPEVKLEQLILANILKSKEANAHNPVNLKFDRQSPAIVKSLIGHTVFSLRAQSNVDQTVFDLNTINNSLNFLDKVIARDVDPDQASQLNFADNLWNDLYLNLHNLILKNKKILTELPKIENAHPFLLMINTEINGTSSPQEIKNFLKSSVIVGRSPFLDKWELIKDTIVIRIYIHIVSKKEMNAENISYLHSLKNRLDQNIRNVAALNTDGGISSSRDDLYKSLAERNDDLSVIDAGKIINIEELDLKNKPIFANILSKVIINQGNYSIDISKIKNAYLDFTPKTESPPTLAMTPFFNQVPYYVHSASETVITSSAPGICTRREERDRDCNSPKGCHPGPLICVEWMRYKYTVSTVLPARPAQPAKMVKAIDGINLQVSTSEKEMHSDFIIFANGEGGFEGTQGTSSPFCYNDIYNYYSQGKSGVVMVTSEGQNNSKYIFDSVPFSRMDVEAGLSGDGGDAGNGANIEFSGSSKGISLISLGGIGGPPGRPAVCSIRGDRSRNVGAEELVSILGAKGKDGKAGKVLFKEVSNEN